jgi:photosystem II stability/assembly factor-like uncharacterized protein
MKKYFITFLIIFFTTTKIFSQWVELSIPTIFTLFSVSAVNDDVIWTCASGNNIFRSTNGGDSWVNAGATLPPPAGVETCIYALDANTAFVSLYAGYPNNAYVFKTSNGGQNWNLIFTQFPGFITAINMKDANNGFMVGWPQGGRWSLWKTSNGGTTWDSTGMYIAESDPNNWSFENDLVYQGSNIWFGARGRGVYHSTNNGASWALQNLTAAGFCYPSAIWFENANNGFTSAQLNIVKTTNGGNVWSPLAGSLLDSEVVRGIVSVNMQYVWYVRDMTPKIYYSSNGGVNWVVQHTSPSGTGYKHLTKSRDGEKLWAITIGGEIERYDNISSVHQVSTEIPGTYKLFQNYPNPFNPATTIKYNIAKASSVELKVYNMLGKEVAMLVNEKQNQGTFEVTFDGSRLSSGTYFYKLSANGYSEVKKMALVK